jgi:2-succinyl-6-hydroxy-2,4-cyclohexadiene-1-carboxylate synthase
MLLYLHGFTGGAWEAEALRRLWGREVHSLSLPGHDFLSIPGDCGMPAACARVVGFVEAQNERQVDLVGYSMGGRVALSLAVEKPEWLRKLVLISARPGWDVGEERRARIERDERLAARIEEIGMLSFAEEWEASPIIASQRSIPAGIRRRMQATRRAHSVAGIAASLREMGSAAMPALWDRLKDISVETLWVTGSSDSTYGTLVAEAVDRNPLFSHEVVPDAGHCTHLENPAVFRRMLERFL